MDLSAGRNTLVNRTPSCARRGTSGGALEDFILLLLSREPLEELVIHAAESKGANLHGGTPGSARSELVCGTMKWTHFGHVFCAGARPNGAETHRAVLVVRVEADEVLRRQKLLEGAVIERGDGELPRLDELALRVRKRRRA